MSYSRSVAYGVTSFQVCSQTRSHTPVNDIDTSDTTHYYSGSFEGYSAELEVDCDLSSLGYEITATGPSVCLWKCPATTRGSLSPTSQQ